MRSYFSPPLADLDSGYVARNYAVYINASVLHDILDTAYYLAMAGTCAATSVVIWVPRFHGERSKK